MKKILLILFCLFLLTSCRNTDVAVLPQVNSKPSLPDSPSASQPVKPESPANVHTHTNEPPVEEKTQTVSVAVYGLEKEIIFSADANFYEGITAFDILLDSAGEKNIPVVYSGSKAAAYVSSIGGLAEKQHGGMSGWIYTINGESIMKPSGKCELSPGDRVEWKYMTEF